MGRGVIRTTDHKIKMAALKTGLVSTAWLAQQIAARSANLRVIDATYHMPTAKRDAQAEYLQQHIPGAGFFDVDAVKDTDSSLPHRLPSAAQFAQGLL